MSSRVLISSPVHQKAAVLQEFLTSLRELEKDGLDVSYLFIDDNRDVESKALLQQFTEQVEQSFVVDSGSEDIYVCDDVTHHWNEALVWKVAAFKNFVINSAVEENYDYLFLIDSDLVLHPRTLKQLISTEKDIISEVFWTQWQPDSLILPQVWLSDHYTLVPYQRGEELSQEEAIARRDQFLAQLRQPGVYEVGGLGACTVLSQNALQGGVNFNEIKNLSFWGEDRHFCIRAAALGFSLYVDTHYPAYHIYRESDLAGVAAFKQRCAATVVSSS